MRSVANVGGTLMAAAIVCLLPEFVIAADPTFDTDRWRSQVDQLTAAIEADADDVSLYSRRGDALFYLADFKKAVADYDRMVELEASVDSSHWRRGIALFYAGEYNRAARQFERYHSFDNVDRENGIWRYLCQVKADGIEKARAVLLKYEKDDREPFDDVYRLFAGTIKADAIIDRIGNAQVAESEREKRRFYAHLYIGLWHAVHDRPTEAKPHLKLAVANKWGPTASYGPRYMWHVGRLHYDLLVRETEGK